MALQEISYKTNTLNFLFNNYLLINNIDKKPHNFILIDLVPLLGLSNTNIIILKLKIYNFTFIDLSYSIAFRLE